MEASFTHRDECVLREAWSKACQSFKMFSVGLETEVDAAGRRLFSSRALLLNKAIHNNYRSQQQ
jgi:hypothetical protein